MTTWTREFKAQMKYASPPGQKLMAHHQLQSGTVRIRLELMVFWCSKNCYSDLCDYITHLNFLDWMPESGLCSSHVPSDGMLLNQQVVEGNGEEYQRKVLAWW